MICFLFLSLWNELLQDPRIYTLHSKSALREAELPRALHWFADGRNSGGGGRAGPAPPAAVGASEDGTESLIQRMWLLPKERVFKGMLISRRRSASSSSSAEQLSQLGPQGACRCGLERRVKAHQVWAQSQQRRRFSGEWDSLWTCKRWGEKMVEAGGRKANPGAAIYIIGGWERQEADAEEGLQEGAWEAAELCTVKCNVNQKYCRISN